MSKNNQPLTTKIFVERAKQQHSEENYDYSKVKYITARNKVCIVCPKHGEFWQTPMKHLQGQGCPMCMQNKPLTKEEFIKKSKKIHSELHPPKGRVLPDSMTSLA